MNAFFLKRPVNSAIAACALIASLPVSGQVIMSTTASYSQNFDSPTGLASTGGPITWVDNSNIANWYWQNTGTGTTYTVNNGSSNTGTKYSYGTTSATDRAMGSVGSGGAAAGSFAWGILLKNTSGASITDIKVSYTGEQWRDGGNASLATQTLSFYFMTSATSFTTLNPNNNGSWTSVPALNFISPTHNAAAATLDGNAAANKVIFTNVPVAPLTLADGSFIMLKWDDPDHTGNDHGLSIDDVTISWTASATIPTVGFTSSTSTVVEGGTDVIGIAMSTAPSSNVTVDIADLLTGSAVSGTDYNTFTTTTLTFTPAGSYPQTQNVSLVTIDNPLFDPSRTVNFSLTVTGGTANTGITSHTSTITNDDLAPLVINEVDYDQPSTDNAEWVEIKNNGATPINLNGFKIELVNGAGGGAATYQTITLPSFSLAAGGYYVVGNNAGTPNINQVVLPTTNLIQNGSPDAIGLRDPSNNLLDALSYEGTSGAPYAEAGGTLLEGPGTPTAINISIGRIPDGTDSNNNTADWQLLCVFSPGASNTASTDTDGDSTPDCIDGCPSDPNKVSPGTCGCGIPDTDTDSDGVADCIDGCPLDPFKIVPGQCGCGNPDTDSDGDLVADCVDICPGFDDNVDTDGDAIPDGCDDCPLLAGEQGDPCDDGNVFTANDVINGSCVCAGTPVPCDNWSLVINTDAAGADITWTMVEDGTANQLDAGGPYPNNATITEPICVPVNNCWDLNFFDSACNGITPGGWVLRDNNGKRVIDNSGNGGAYTCSATPFQAFCSPIGTDVMTLASCDKMNWLASEYIVANPNNAVSAQWMVGNQTDDGYQFWFYNPVGGYNRRILHNHATSMGYGPPSATRACHLPLTFSPFPLPANVFLNVRVRSLVNGVYSEFGPACRFMIDAAGAACPPAQLDNNPLHIGTTYSCGVTGKVVNASGYTGKIYALPVLSQPGNVVACKYKFTLSVPAEGYTRVVVVPSYALTLGPWLSTPLLCGTFTYDVTVQASFDCTTYCPAGPTCTVEITNPGGAIPCTAPFQGGGGNLNIATQDGGDLSLWPNPNRGDQLYVELSEVPEGVSEVTLDLYDIFGQRVMSRVIATDGGFSTVLDLEGSLADGLYMVNVTAGEKTYTQRLIIE